MQIGLTAINYLYILLRVSSLAKCIILSKSQADPSSYSVIRICGKPVANVSRAKLLDGEFDSGLTRAPHISNIPTKMSASVTVLYKYHHLLSHGWPLKLNSITLSILQKRALRHVIKVDRCTSSTEVYAVSVDDTFEIQSLLFLCKSTNDMLPEAFFNLFTHCSEVVEHI